MTSGFCWQADSQAHGLASSLWDGLGAEGRGANPSFHTLAFTGTGDLHTDRPHGQAMILPGGLGYTPKADPSG